MRPLDVPALRRGNLMYREPCLYADFLRGDDTNDAIADRIDRFAPETATAVDFGCGTGRSLRELCDRRDLIGVGTHRPNSSPGPIRAGASSSWPTSGRCASAGLSI